MKTHRIAVTLAVVAGCSSPGALVVEHEPGTPATVRTVTTAGTYGLFVAGDAELLLRYPLAVGEQIGFDHPPPPTMNQVQIDWLYGVAGRARGRLDLRQTYQWRRLPDRQ